MGQYAAYPGTVVFEFDKDNVVSTGAIPIRISDADPAGQVAARIAEAIFQAIDEGLLIGITVDVVDDRVFIDGAIGLVDSSGAITVEGDGYGIG